MTRSYVVPLALVLLYVIAFGWIRFAPAIGPAPPSEPAFREEAPSLPHTPLSQLAIVGPAAMPPVSRAALIVPVAGVARQQLSDTWGQARAQGRQHQGIDILAPAGTPVFAAADGRIAKFFDSVRGGITIYEFDTSEHLVYYYAHLSGRVPGLREGDAVRQGQVIGSVGTSGNAPVPHLHFEIQRLTPEHHWWQAEAMNPYPYLRAGQAPA